MKAIHIFKKFVTEALINPQQKSLLPAGMWVDFQKIADDPKTQANISGNEIDISYQCKTPYLDEFDYAYRKGNYSITTVINIAAFYNFIKEFRFFNITKHLVVNNQLLIEDCSYLKYSSFIDFLSTNPVQLPESFQNFMIL